MIYKIKISEEYSGDVMGKLTNLNIAVEDVNVSNGIWDIKVFSEENIINQFKPWLSRLTNSTGIIEN